MQRQAPRGDKTLRAFVKQIALDQRAGDEPLQILRRLSLHAGGDFFAEQFEQKVGMGLDVVSSRCNNQRLAKAMRTESFWQAASLSASIAVMIALASSR